MALSGRLAILAGGLGILAHAHDICIQLWLTKHPGGLGSSTGNLLRKHGARLAILYAPFEATRKDQILEETYGSPRKVRSSIPPIYSRTLSRHF